VSTGGKLFAISVSRGRTVVKVRRGLTLLAKDGKPLEPVVVGRGQQAVAPAQGLPRLASVPPTDAERTALDRLEKGLPAELDRSKPEVRITRQPPDRTSLRTARFDFESEPGAVLSCAVDAEELRLCVPPLARAVPPGRHTFRVRATDTAGLPSAEKRAVWVYDGSRIAFTSQNSRVGNREIYVMDPEGDDAVRLTRNDEDDDDPEWSPDGRRIAWSGNRRDGQGRVNQDIYTIDVQDGSDVRRLTSDAARDRTPAWSVTGKIAFESTRDGNREIYVMDEDGSEQRRLTADSHEDFDPAWSPDGLKIAFASDRSGNLDIYVMDDDGGNLRAVTNDPSAEFGPSWSPDGTRIVFHGRRLPPHVNNLYVVELATGAVERLKMGEPGYAYDATDEYPTWAPDGAHIAFMSTRQTNDDGEAEYRLFILDVGSGGVTGPVSVAEDDVEPFLGPNLFPAWSRPSTAAEACRRRGGR
jgi:Tol biopolymer transport system component